MQIVHEALLRHWPLLGGWLEENRAWLRARQRLTEYAHEWDDGNRHPDRLLHGAQLSALHEQLRSVRRAQLGKLETTFLSASERRHARTQRARTAFTSVLIIAVVVAAGFAAVAQHSSRAAQEQQAIAQSRQLAAEAEARRASDPATSLLLSLEAYRIQHTNEAVSSLLAAQAGYFTARLHSPSGPVNAVAYDPAAAHILASAGQNDQITLWDTSKQRPTAILRGRSPFYSVAFDTAGRFLAGAEQNGTTVLWNARTRQRLGSLGPDRDAADAVAFSPDGQILAAAGYDGTVRLWRTDTLQVARIFHVGYGTISGIAFSRDGRQLAAACADHNIRLWDLAEASAGPRVLRGHTGLVRTVAFSPDSALLASGSDDGTVRLWDTRTGASRGVLTGGTASVRTLAFSPDGVQLASGGEDNAVRLWDVSTRAQTGALTGPAGAVAGVAFSPDGRTVASADADATVGLWNIAAPPQPGSIATPAVASAPRPGGLVATSGSGQRIYLWNPSRRSRRATLRGQSGQPGAAAAPDAPQATSISFSPDGRLHATPAAGGVAVWNIAAQQRIRTLTAVPANVVAYRPLPRRGNPAIIAAGSTNSDMNIWGSHAARPVQIGGQLGPVNAVAFSPDGTRLAAGSGDGTILLASITAAGSRATVLTIASGHLRLVEAVAFSPDGRQPRVSRRSHPVPCSAIRSQALLVSRAWLYTQGLRDDIGDDRTRFRDARGLKSYAGSAPITIASGKSRIVRNRKVKNQRLAAAGYVWIFGALPAPGIKEHYDRRRAAGDRHAAAMRNLFNRLLGCLHHCLQTGQTFDLDKAFPSPTAQHEPVAA